MSLTTPEITTPVAQKKIAKRIKSFNTSHKRQADQDTREVKLLITCIYTGLFLSVQAPEKVGLFSPLLFQMWEDYSIERANNCTEVRHLWRRTQELGLIYTILCHQHTVTQQ